MRTGSQQRHAPRWVLSFLAALIAALAAILGFTTASASATGVAETRVGAINVTGEVLVGPPEHIDAGQSRDAAENQPQVVVATGVAAKTGASALDALSPAIRSNVDDAIERAAAGKVRFPGHDGKVYNNSEGLLPRGGNYTEWTAAQAGAKRGADRVIIKGDPANPNAIYYWDHVNPPVRIGP